MYNLTEITEAQFAMMELMKDSLFACIPESEYGLYVFKSIEFGEKAYEEYKSCDLEKTLWDAGVDIIRDEREFEHVVLDYTVWAQITYGKHVKKVELFMPEIRRKQQILAQNGIETDETWIAKLHLAHEFYHFLEYSSLGLAGERLKPVRQKKFLRTVGKPLRAASEIAAHSFAGRYMRSNILPQMTDYLVLLQEGIMTKETFQGKLEQANVLLYGSQNGGKDVSEG